MEHVQIDIPHPAERDGSPAEVAAATLADLQELADQLASCFTAAELQVRNAVLDQIVAGDTDPATAADIFRDWEGGRLGQTLRDLGGTAERLRARAIALERALR